MERKLFALLLIAIICEFYVGHVETSENSTKSNESMSFANKVVLITGASSGIGAGAALHLAKKGASVSLIGRNETRLKEVRDQIISAGGPTPLVVVADITKDAQQIMDKTVNHFGQLNVLINSAGIQTDDNAETIDMNDYDLVMNTNVRSMVQLMKLAIPHLKKTKGNILNVSSVNAMRVIENTYVYSMSKAAVSHLTESAARDLASKGIRVNAICPGVIRTRIFERAHGWTKQRADEFLDEAAKAYPLGRIGEVSDTSAAMEYLCSDAASFVTGTCLLVDGGALVSAVQY